MNFRGGGGSRGRQPFTLRNLGTAALYIRLAVIAGIVLGLFLLLNVLRGILTNWLWYSSVGYVSVYATVTWTRLVLFVAGTTIAGAIVGVSYWATFKNSWGPVALPIPAQALELVRRAVIAAMVAMGVLVAFSFGSALSGRWEVALNFLNRTPFGMTDPEFGMDIGFYVFTLPLLHAAQGWLMGALIVTALTAAGLYVLVFSLRGVNPLMTPGIRNHMAATAAAIMVTVSAAHFLDVWETLFSPAGAITGATYADIAARIPALRLMAVLALVAAGIMLFAIRSGTLQQSMRLLMAGFGLWIAGAIVGGLIAPAIVQRLIVTPSQLERERPYIQRNNDWTRYGFDLDRVDLRAHDASDEAIARDIAGNPETIENIRVWDPSPLLDVYNQVQHLRLYYTFHDIDVDRYTVDGRYTQVLVGPRELNAEGLDASARNWVNEKLVYTHGYGLAMSPSARITGTGQPAFLVKDVPPSGTFAVTQPRIYYGEITKDFVIVNTEEPEFDRPATTQGDQPVYLDRYDGDGGVRLSTIFHRLMYAWEFGDLNVLISGQLTGESRILYRRTIQERVSTLAPFLQLDGDPYMVLLDGRLLWVQDAYTVTDRMPYSTRQPLTAGDFTVGRFNYVRNSVKVVVDAYDGSVTFYAIEANRPDPLIQTYAKAFPSLFRPIDEMPDGLRAHLRYPERLFLWQANTFLQYHMTDPKEFFLKEDQWEIPREIVQQNQQKTVEPYYVIMRLPGQPRAEFVLILPFVPKEKPNLVAWMVARSDGDNYGEMIVYTFPQGRLFNGPNQVEARIDNDPRISEQFTLWSRSGTTVLRGNLLVIPIGDSLIYAEPVYLQATNLNYPELRRIILANSDRVVMEPTIEAAVNALLGRPTTPPGGGDMPGGTLPPEQIRALIEALRRAIDGLQGNIDDLARALDNIEQFIPEATPTP
ncbi:MAG: UPF0182 family protein [SAR202 cluster bacterium]|nr:UPF0182 family protein [SAR202 cluster bacterium]